MNKIKVASVLVRIFGAIILVFALALSFVVNSTTSQPWKEILKKTGEDYRIRWYQRTRFDRDYQQALLDAKDLENNLTFDERLQKLKPHFAWISQPMGKADAEKVASSTAKTIKKYTDGDFNAAKYLEIHEDAERVNEVRLEAAYTYLDTLSAPAKGKNAKKTKTVRETCEEKYSKLVGEHGEEVGSFNDFSETLASMLKTYIAQNGKVTVSVYLDTAFDYEEYRAALASNENAVAAEEGAELLNSFAQNAEKQINGETADYKVLFESAYTDYRTEYSEDAYSYDFFVKALDARILQSGFAGDTASIHKEAAEQYKKWNSATFDKELEKFISTLIADCNSHGSFWLFTGRWSYAILLLGIALLVLGKYLDKLALQVQIKRVGVSTKEIDPDVLVRVEHLCQYFGAVKAVDDVSFDIRKGEVFGLVGESGCGKTTTGRSIIKLYDITSGSIYFKGIRIAAGVEKYEDEIHTLKKERKNSSEERTREINARIAELKKMIATAKFDHKYCDKAHASEIVEAVETKFRSLMADAGNDPARLRELKKQYERELHIAKKQRIVTKIQMIFQDPVASLDPRMTVREIIAEGLRIRGETDEHVIDSKVYDILETVGLVREHAGRYPHEFSGGQKQRIGVARAVVMNPEMIIADEPVSALDVSIQAQVINLLDRLRQEMGLTILFIAHDLSVVKYFSDRIGVMYYGHMVELASSDELFAHPLHPYTKSLLSAIPLPDPEYEKQRRRIKYDPLADHDYSVEKPSMREVCPGHFVMCSETEYRNYLNELKEN